MEYQGRRDGFAVSITKVVLICTPPDCSEYHNSASCDVQTEAECSRAGNTLHSFSFHEQGQKWFLEERQNLMVLHAIEK
jgi:hypothetical protein